MALEKELGELIKKLNPYSDVMEFPCCATPREENTSLAQFQVELDNHGQEWSYRGSIEQIKRAVRITYRYPVVERDDDGNSRQTGIWVTEHLMIGYAGGNGA